jgi:hypothetical protein
MIPVSLGDRDRSKTIPISEDSGPESAPLCARMRTPFRMRAASRLWNKRKAGMVKGAI